MPQRLAQHLIARGLLPARVVDEALRRLGRDGGTLDTVLLEMGAVSEAGILQDIGVPTVVCGPGRIAVAHQPDEYVEVEQLEQCMKFLFVLAERMEQGISLQG